MRFAPEFEALFRHAPVPMYLWVQRGEEFSPVLEDFNAAALQVTGGRVAELRGQSYKQLYAEDMQIQQDLQDCFLQHKPIFRKMRYRLRSNGLEGEFRVAYIPVTLDSIVVVVV